MMTRFCTVFALALFPLVSWADYRIGTWTIDITPTTAEASESCLGGYGQPFQRCGSVEIKDNITVRSLTISDHDTRTHLAVIDAIGVGDSLISDIKTLVNYISFGTIKENQVTILATHTHAGPDLQGLWGGVSTSYRNRVVINTAISIVLSKLFSFESEAYVFRSSADVVNRRGWDIVEDNVNVLDFRRKGTNKRIATLINISAHPTIMDESNSGYSAGYVHFLRAKVESTLATSALVINGALGDAEPRVNGEHTYRAAMQFGEDTANRLVLKSENAAKVSGDFEVHSFSFYHPVTNDAVIGAVYAGLLDLELEQDNTTLIPLSYFSFGDDVTGILYPGEALTRLYLRIKDAMPGTHQFFFGLAGRSLGYFIPSDEFGVINGRLTEETASLDIYVGDESLNFILDNIE